MARMVFTVEVDQIEEDADRQRIAEQMVDLLQAQWCYVDVALIEVEGE
ncbi:hypothetical protein [Pseudomonas phage Njord]|uniref:Uncharacterized protein n=1 Tax=Pseudomonas phage Njord TaxID=2163985 RepID=A0A2S1GMH8_9CAUD|nr:hypothetical protein HOT08_gp10 [Pseudomonas phage Njord]AWD90598.1 hypothetical protein [Pseudomonas phage Njord]